MQGDWHPNSKMKSEIINIVLDENGLIRHTGIGYHVYSPNGNYITGTGHTWETDPKIIKKLQDVINLLLKDVTKHEGLTWDHSIKK